MKSLRSLHIPNCSPSRVAAIRTPFPLSLLALLLLLATATFAQTTQSATPTSAPTSASAPASAELKLQLITDEGKKQIQATLTANGKPVEGATVAFRVKRTFGNLQIGKDQTLDDGSAQTPFPSDLPGGSTGELHVTAIVQAPSKYADTLAHGMFSGAAVVHPSDNEFPRALWAPRAPWLLVITIVGLLAAVWCVYAYVVAQLWALARRR